MNAVTVVACTETDLPSATEVETLYASVGWSAYTRDLDALMSGLRGSLRVVVARVDRSLVGLARVVGDGATICYLQNVLVSPRCSPAGCWRAACT